MIPLNEGDPKKVAAVENIPDLGKVRPYQVKDRAVLVANDHCLLQITNFSSLPDGHYYFGHDINDKGQDLSPFFDERHKGSEMISLPLEVVRRLHNELSVWTKGLGSSQHVKLTYRHDTKQGKTFLELHAPGTLNQVADKLWSYSWEKLSNDSYFRAVCNSKQLLFALSVFGKMKDTEKLPVKVILRYNPKKFEKKETGKTYNHIWFLECEYMGHEVVSAYSTKSVYTPKDKKKDPTKDKESFLYEGNDEAEAEAKPKGESKKKS